MGVESRSPLRSVARPPTTHCLARREILRRKIEILLTAIEILSKGKYAHASAVPTTKGFSRSSEERPGKMPVSPEGREIAVALSTLIFRRMGNYGPVKELAELAQLEVGDFRVVVNARIAATRDISDRKYFDYVRSISFKSHNATTKRLSSKILSKLEEKAAATRERSSLLQREIDME